MLIRGLSRPLLLPDPRGLRPTANSLYFQVNKLERPKELLAGWPRCSKSSISISSRKEQKVRILVTRSTSNRSSIRGRKRRRDVRRTTRCTVTHESSCRLCVCAGHSKFYYFLDWESVYSWHLRAHTKKKKKRWEDWRWGGMTGQQKVPGNKLRKSAKKTAFEVQTRVRLKHVGAEHNSVLGPCRWGVFVSKYK